MFNRKKLRDRLRDPASARELLFARITALFLVTATIVLLASLAFYFLERHAPGTEIKSYGDALFWTASQMSTVSSSLPNPITAGGRALAVATDFVSVATLSILFGTITQHIHFRTPKREERLFGSR
jgi:ABC-type Na+ efflux pump permease subunit